MKLLPISIVMIIYNSEAHIEESIESILNQIFCNFELIIIDYGSADNTVNIRKFYSDSRIRIISGYNTNSLITVFSLMKGKYIAYMEADDIMLPHRLYKQYEFMEENQEIDISGSWVYNFGDCYGAVYTPINHNDIEYTALFNNPMHFTTIMVKKSLLQFPAFQNNKLFKRNYKYVDDYKLWMYLLIKDFKFANIPKILVKHRIYNKQKEIETPAIINNIQLDYLNFITKKIIKRDNSFSHVLESLASLYKNKKISFDNYKYIVSNLYNNY